MLKKRLIALAAALGLLTAGLAGCSNGSATTGADGDKKLQIVTAFYPLQFASEQVAGERGEVSTLTAPGAEPHDLELTPKQIASLSGADIVVYQRGFQSAVDAAVNQAKPKVVIDVANVVTLHALADHADEHADHDHASAHPSEGASHDDHDHASESPSEHASEEAGHDHDHDHAGGMDPHAWLDPTNMVKITTAIQAKLAEVDASHAADYTKNLDRINGELTALDESYTKGLAKCQRTEFITTHSAFGYLAERYKLTQIGISGVSPDDEPSPARIAEIHTLVAEHGITTVFFETIASPKVAQAIAGDLNLATDVLDPLEGITPQSRGNDYIAVMKSNLDALKKANACS